MRTFVLLLLCVVSLAGGALLAQVPSVAPSAPHKKPDSARPAPAGTLSAADLADLLRVRKSVWEQFFIGDTAGMRAVLSPSLIAITSSDTLWHGLEETLASSAAFAKGGGAVRGLTFTSDVVHNLGDVAVMFSQYRYERITNGASTTVRGHVTEVFVKRNGRWEHTSWHIDRAA